MSMSRCLCLTILSYWKKCQALSAFESWRKGLRVHGHVGVSTSSDLGGGSFLMMANEVPFSLIPTLLGHSYVFGSPHIPNK